MHFQKANEKGKAKITLLHVIPNSRMWIWVNSMPFGKIHVRVKVNRWWLPNDWCPTRTRAKWSGGQYWPQTGCGITSATKVCAILFEVTTRVIQKKKCAKVFTRRCCRKYHTTRTTLPLWLLEFADSTGVAQHTSQHLNTTTTMFSSTHSLTHPQITQIHWKNHRQKKERYLRRFLLFKLFDKLLFWTRTSVLITIATFQTRTIQFCTFLSILFPFPFRLIGSPDR